MGVGPRDSLPAWLQTENTWGLPKYPMPGPQPRPAQSEYPKKYYSSPGDSKGQPEWKTGRNHLIWCKEGVRQCWWGVGGGGCQDQATELHLSPMPLPPDSEFLEGDQPSNLSFLKALALCQAPSGAERM